MHVLGVGMTMSGKSFLAKSIAASLKKKGIGVIALDPLRDPGWHADFVTDDAEKFLATVKASRRCAVFVDESGSTVGRYNPEMEWLATQGRHWGHRVYFLTQRGSQISPTIRDNCSELFLFRVSRKDAALWAEDFGFDELEQAASLPQYHFFHAKRFGICERKILK